MQIIYYSKGDNVSEIYKKYAKKLELFDAQIESIRKEPSYFNTIISLADIKNQYEIFERRIEMEDFYKTDINEQETHILVDYVVKTVRIYTSRAGIYRRLCKRLGEPTRKYYINGVITGADWEIKFNDKIKLKSVFSRPAIIGSL